jgi:hypothetical protein
MGSLLSFGLRGGVVMAMHRRPLAAATPPELLTFRVEEWSSFEAWCAARRDWVKGVFGVKHGSGGFCTVGGRLRQA